MMPQANRTNGVTLVELMVVVAVLAIIAAIAVPAYTGYITTAKISECQNEVLAIQTAEEEFFLTNNTYFAGSGVSGAGSIPDASNGLYIPTASATDPQANCAYAVTTAGGGNSYTITATGQNDLAGKGVVHTIAN
jgi:type IV pilus assembly protein PilE